jgi:hypothetical protein
MTHRAWSAAALFALVVFGCDRKGARMEEKKESDVACELGVFTPAERARERALLEEHLARSLETRELADGYAFRYPPDAALFARMAELVGLEHRCCPFLDFHLEWAGSQESPWLHVTGGPRAKAFMAEAFGRR